VSNYRIYCLDGLNKVASASWLEAEGDEAVLERVKELHDGYKCEVWDGQRLVARVDLRPGGGHPSGDVGDPPTPPIAPQP
jgi:hypothetical protein